MVEFNVLRDAMASGREGNNKRSLNAMVGKIIDAFMDFQPAASKVFLNWDTEEKKIQKTEFPEELSTAIYSNAFFY